ncbi:RNI-like protein [Coccomyxa subellipsoidea C-169]|uniref:RNI-like protein n=1 Tax=Coccomyxa subellipsoidea (strain C-169) TaxID=574566 RepID=I0YU19_COCSC|nr:RNI-like protein [Coccomyxa subellipsoidea C-169]EIE21888.1 RNI-like protein [Coccomyxa subellipsoidea C-169]|eukprot:XP_005646432.1 RNI-like protein [Coccomyxa subellipsoidea C-169]
MNDGAFWELPDELMAIITSHLTEDEDRHSLRLVCKHWRSAVNGSVSRLSGNMYWTCDVHLLMMPLFPSVAYVNLSQCELVSHIHSLSALPALKRLDLNWCTGLNPASLHALTALTGLSHLDMSGCADAVTDDSMRHLADLHHSLEWLSLQGCPAVSSRGLEPLQSCHKLSYVDLSGTSVVSLQSLSECMSLRRLRLSGCARLADGALHSLTGLPALGDLDLRGSKHLITATLLNDLAHLPGLRKLDFEGCEDLADASVDGLTRLSSLTHLNVSDCPTLSQSGLSRLTGRMPRHCAVFHGYS